MITENRDGIDNIGSLTLTEFNTNRNGTPFTGVYGVQRVIKL